MDHPFVSRDSVTRPNNTNTYTSKDVINESVAKLMVFRDIVPREGMGFWILAARVISNNVPSITGSFLLLLFRERVIVPIDHAVFAPTVPELHTLFGIVVFDTGIKISNATIYTPSSFSPVYGVTKYDKKEVYGVLLDNSGYVPGAMETFRVLLSGTYELPERHGMM
jgi:hypothetical protein